MRILSGIQPSGAPHLGNYFTMMKRIIHQQQEEQNELYCFIADYHSLTSLKEATLLRQNVLEISADFLACGLDPERSVFWVQSDVPQITELAWILAQHVSVPQLELAHSYKDKVEQGLSPSAGLFYYPVLMAADILAFGTQRVPVGKDQKQHLEICRDIARRFNNSYGATFIEPEADIIADMSIIPGIDGRKMSKSYANAIYPFAPEKELKKAVMSIVTDSKGVQESKEPEGSVLYSIYSLFLDSKEQQELADRFRTPGTGYGHIKQDLLVRILETFQPYRQKRESLLKKPEDIQAILKEGASRASQSAKQYLEQARAKVGLG